VSPGAAGIQFAAAVGTAAVIAAGIVIFGWPAFTVLAFYWLENVVIGGFTAVRILAAGARTERYLESLATAAFFTLHYGLFCVVHGVFVATLFGGIHSMHGLADPVLLMIGRIAGDGVGAVVIATMVVAAALDSQRAWRDFDDDAEQPIQSIAKEPYGRVVVLHAVLIGGGILLQALQLPALAALLLVAFKLVYDLRLLRRQAPAAADRRR
jgi:hypothetical protein